MAEKRFAVVRLGSLGDIVPHISRSGRIACIVSIRANNLADASSLGRSGCKQQPCHRNLASGFSRSLVCPSSNRKLRAFCPEAAIDFQGLWKSAIPPFLAGIPRRIGFSSFTVREYGGTNSLYRTREMPHRAYCGSKWRT